MSSKKTEPTEKKLRNSNSLEPKQNLSNNNLISTDMVADQGFVPANKITLVKKKKIVSTDEELSANSQINPADAINSVETPASKVSSTDLYQLAQNTAPVNTETVSTTSPTTTPTAAPASAEAGFSSSGVQGGVSPPVTPPATNPVVEGVKSFSSAIDSALAGLSTPAQFALLGGGVVVAGAGLGGGSGGGGSAAAAAAGAAVDATLTNTGSSLKSGTAGNATVVLTFNKNLDAAHAPSIQDFAVQIKNGGAFVANSVDSLVVNGSTITLTLHDAVSVGSSLKVSYTDPVAAGNGHDPILDTSGNNIASFSSGTGVLADGLIRGAQIYLDTPTGLQIVPGVITDSEGNFSMSGSANPNNYAIVAVGGVNIDTGLPNTMQLKAPAGSSSINPITTIVTAVQQSSGIVAMTDAEAAVSSSASTASVVKSLNITLQGGATDLLSYNPIALGDTSTQKVAAQVATVVALASSEASAGQVTTTSNAVFSSLATAITSADAANTLVSMTDASTISQALSKVSVSAAVQSAIADATSSIANAADISSISKAQSQFLDTIAPDAPTSITATAITNDTTPTVRVNLNVTSTDGKAAVAGDQVILLDGGSQAGTATLSATDISNGYVEVTSTSTLLPGSHSFTAKLVDQSGNTGSVSSASAVTIDTVGPSVLIKSSAGNIATGATVTLTIIFSEAVAGFTKDDITIPNGAVLGTLSAPTTLSDGSVKYTIDYTAPSTGGVGTLQIAANSYTDIATNNGAISNSLDLSVIAPPLVSIKSIGGADSKVSTQTGDRLIAGFGEAGLDVTISKTGGADLGTAKADASGVWTYTLTDANITTLGQGPDSITASQTKTGVTGTSAAFTISVDTVAPTGLTISDVAGNNAINASEKTAGVTISGAAEANSTVNLTIAGSTKVLTAAAGSWTYTLTDADYKSIGTATTLSAVAIDAAGNVGETVTKSITVDTVAPILGQFKLAGTGTGVALGMTNLATSSIVFSAESGATVNVYKGTVSAGNLLGTATETGTTGSYSYTFGASVLSQNANTISIVATDLAGNTSTRTGTITLDSVAPTVSIANDEASGVVSNIAGGNILYTFTFSEGVTEFTADDITVANGTKAVDTFKMLKDSNGNSNKIYTIEVTPTAGFEGNVTVDVAASAAIDKAGNNNTVATQSVQQVDTKAPTVVITDDEAGVGNIAGGDIVYTFTFSDAVTGFVKQDVVVNHGTAGTFAAVANSGGKVYTLSVTPEAGYEGNVTVDVPAVKPPGAATQAVDIALNPNAAATQSVQVVDTKSPTVVITDDESGVANIAGGDVVYTFTFSEPVTGFTIDDITVANATGTSVPTKGTFTAVSSTVYTLAVTPTAGYEGYMTVNVASAAANDLNSNPSIQAAQSSQQVDTKAPTVVITDDESGVANIAGGDVVYTFTFSEPVTGFDATDVTVANGTKGTFTAVSSTVYTLAVTPTAGYEGNMTVDVAASKAIDANSNPNAAATQSVQVVDTKAPTVVITDNKTGVANIADATVLYTFTFSEPVTDFIAADVVVANGVKGTFTATSSTVYTLVVTPTAGYEGSVTVDVPSVKPVGAATQAKDGALNINASASQSVQVVDFSAPAAPATVLFSDTGSSLSDGKTSSGVVNVSGVETGASWQYSTDATNWITGSGSSFTVTGDGAKSVQVRQTDAAGNLGAVSTALVFNLDTTAPTFSSSATATQIPENSGASQAIYTAVSSDGSGVGGLVYTLKNTGDASLLSINSSSGVVTLTANPNYETKSSYSFTVVSTDLAGNAAEKAVTLAIGNLDEVPPTITSAATATAKAENSGAGQAIYTVTSTDTGDISAGVTYSLANSGDSSLLSINSSTGVVTLTANPNYENKSSYSFTVVATDAATNATNKAVTLAITDVNEAPTTVGTVSNQTAVVNQPFSLDLKTYFTDVDTTGTWGTLSYSASGTLPVGITLSNGVLSGTPTSTSSASTITITATDGGGLTVTQPFSINVVQAPVISSFAVIDATAPTGIGTAGEAITFTVTLSENVTVTNINNASKPTITFLLGGANGQSVIATYDSASSGNTWIFKGTVPSSGDGTFAISAIDLKGATVIGNTSNQAMITAAVGQTNTSYTVDNTDPTISNLAIDATNTVGVTNSYLNTGDVVVVKATMSEAVAVTGTPKVGLTIGSATKYAMYDSASSTPTNLVFKYTIASGDTDTNGISITGPLNLNSGTIKDLVGQNSALTFTAIGDSSGYKVDTTLPVAPSMTFADTGVLNNDAKTNNGIVTLGDLETNASWQYTTDNGAHWTTGTGSSFTLTGDGVKSVKVHQTDTAGNLGPDSSALSLTLDTVAPVFSSGLVAAPIDTGTPAGVIYTASSTDTGGVGGTVYSLKSVSDSSSFTIDPTSGAVSIKAAPNYAIKSSYAFTIVATDLAGNASEKDVSLAIGHDVLGIDTSVLATTITAGKALDVTSNIVLGFNSSGIGASDTFQKVDARHITIKGVLDASHNQTWVDSHTYDVSIGTLGSHVGISGTGANTKINIDENYLVDSSGAFNLDLGATYTLSIDAGAFVDTATGNGNSITSVNFTTIVPGGSVPSSATSTIGTSANPYLASNYGAQAYKMDVSGNLVASSKWLSIEGVGNGTGDSLVNLDASGGSFIFVMTDANQLGGSTGNSGFDTTTDLNVKIKNFGGTDKIYLDDRYNMPTAINDASQEAFTSGTGTNTAPIIWGLNGGGGDPHLYLQLETAASSSNTLSDVNVALGYSGLGYSNAVIGG